MKFNIHVLLICLALTKIWIGRDRCYRAYGCLLKQAPRILGTSDRSVSSLTACSRKQPHNMSKFVTSAPCPSTASVQSIEGGYNYTLYCCLKTAVPFISQNIPWNISWSCHDHWSSTWEGDHQYDPITKPRYLVSHSNLFSLEHFCAVTFMLPSKYSGTSQPI